LVLAVFGPHIWRLWTVGKVNTDPVLLNLMMLQLLVSSLWFTSTVVPLAVNKHRGLARVILFNAFLSLGVSWLLLTQTSFGLRGVAVGLVIADVVNTIYVLRNSLHLLDDSLEGFCRSMLTVPKLRRKRPVAVVLTS
jgi:O-antigen/teichoic acid export membrane protein